MDLQTLTLGMVDRTEKALIVLALVAAGFIVVKFLIALAHAISED